MAKNLPDSDRAGPLKSRYRVAPSRLRVLAPSTQTSPLDNSIHDRAA
jgi:hypothetical protein